MKGCPCQNTAPSVARRGLNLAGWTAPALLLVLMPKCPMCLAGYIAVVTGLGLSLPVAAGLRTALVLLCSAALVFMAGWQLRRLAVWWKTGRGRSGLPTQPAASPAKLPPQRRHPAASRT